MTPEHYETAKARLHSEIDAMVYDALDAGLEYEEIELAFASRLVTLRHESEPVLISYNVAMLVARGLHNRIISSDGRDYPIRDIAVDANDEDEAISVANDLMFYETDTMFECYSCEEVTP